MQRTSYQASSAQGLAGAGGPEEQPAAAKLPVRRRVSLVPACHTMCWSHCRYLRKALRAPHSQRLLQHLLHRQLSTLVCQREWTRGGAAELVEGPKEGQYNSDFMLLHLECDVCGGHESYAQAALSYQLAGRPTTHYQMHAVYAIRFSRPE